MQERQQQGQQQQQQQSRPETRKSPRFVHRLRVSLCFQQLCRACCIKMQHHQQQEQQQEVLHRSDVTVNSATSKETTKTSPSLPPTSFPCVASKNSIVAKVATAKPAAEAAGLLP